jgi:hypothetical protein
LQLFISIYKNTGLFMTESEWQTRKKRIDTRLKNLPQPWKIIKYKEGLNTSALHASAVEEYPTEHGPAHNHPSGSLIPSKEDLEITKQLKAAGETLGIRLLDHILFNQKGYYSLLEHNEM